MTITIQQLRDLVKDYWPDYRANIGPMWQSYLRRHDYEKVKTALAEHRAANPDAPQPIWRNVFARLVGGHKLPGLDHERREHAVMRQREAVGRRILTEVPEAERCKAWTQFVSEQPPFVQEHFRVMGWERFPTTMAERIRPGRLDELMKSEPAPEVPPMKKSEFLKAGWDK